MGRSSGANQLAQAASDTFVTDAKPLNPVLPCKKGKTYLKVILRRLDTNAVVPNETVLAGLTAPGAAKTTAAGTGLADYGQVPHGTYSFGVQLSSAGAAKFAPYQSRTGAVPRETDCRVTLKVSPLARLRIVLFNRDGSKMNGATWQVTAGPVQTNGTTGGDGLIDIRVAWNTDAATLKVTLPRGKRIAKPLPPPRDPPTPPYPTTIRPDQWDPPPAAAPDPPEVTWTAEVDILPNANTDDAVKARLVNLGFPCTDGPRTTRSVKAYQRLHKKEYSGSGSLKDVKAHVKSLHDTV